MANLTVKKGENGKYGFVDDAGNWAIEPMFLDAYIWEELAIVHFEKKDDDGDIYDGWTFFKCDEPSENPEEEGWWDHIGKPGENDEYLEAWNEDGGDSDRIYSDGEVLGEDECDEDDWDDEDWDEDDE